MLAILRTTVALTPRRHRAPAPAVPFDGARIHRGPGSPDRSEDNVSNRSFLLPLERIAIAGPERSCERRPSRKSGCSERSSAGTRSHSRKNSSWETGRASTTRIRERGIAKSSYLWRGVLSSAIRFRRFVFAKSFAFSRRVRALEERGAHGMTRRKWAQRGPTCASWSRAVG